MNIIYTNRDTSRFLIILPSVAPIYSRFHVHDCVCAFKCAYNSRANDAQWMLFIFINWAHSTARRLNAWPTIVRSVLYVYLLPLWIMVIVWPVNWIGYIFQNTCIWYMLFNCRARFLTFRSIICGMLRKSLLLYKQVALTKVWMKNEWFYLDYNICIISGRCYFKQIGC